MSALANVAEARITEALESGDFQNLQGAGKPLDLNAYFAAPGSLRAGFGLLKSAGAVPLEVEAMRRIHQLREALANDANPDQVRMLSGELRTRETELAMAMERLKRSIRHDATH